MPSATTEVPTSTEVPTATSTPTLPPPTATEVVSATATATRTNTFPHGPGTPTSTVDATPSATTTETTLHGPTPTDTPAGPTATATATPSPEEATPTATPTTAGAPSLAASIVGAVVELSWSGLAQGHEARILRRLNAAPSGAQDPDSDLVFAGPGNSAEDRVEELLPDVATIASQPAPRREYVYALYSCDLEGDCEEMATAALRPTLVEVLRAGGYVLHWRHSAATVCSDRLDLGTAATTSVPDWWKSCEPMCAVATARQLNDTGRQEATMLGDVVREREVPIGRVISSEYCRNFGTAELMAFDPPIELRQEVTYFVYDESRRCSNSYDLIGEAPAEGTNTAIIGHAGFSGVCAVLGELAWSEAAIFKPDGTGAALLVARVPVDAWDDLP